MKGYIGSVRFFKNLILLLVIIFITVPSVFAFVYQGKTRSMKDELEQYRTTTQQQITDLEKKIGELEEELKTPHVDPDGPAYQQLYPDFYAPQPLQAETKESGVIYLTFDDGPSERTPEVLKVLREENVKATFFVIGRSSEQEKQWMRDIVNEGHTIAMHTYSHNYNKVYASVEDYLADMYKVFTLIKEATGVTPTVFRFPGGSINGYNYEISQDVISEMMRRGFVPYDWNISSEDAATTPPAAPAIVASISRQAQNVNRGVVLMHDSDYKFTTVEALPQIIDDLSQQGFSFSNITPDMQPVVFSYKN